MDAMDALLLFLYHYSYALIIMVVLIVLIGLGARKLYKRITRGKNETTIEGGHSMEDIQSKKTKMADEKYCSECGELIRIKAEICPKCGVRQLPASGTIESSIPSDKKLGEKFLYSAGISFLLFLVLVLAYTPQHSWKDGIVGSCIFAVLSGVIAMVIPTTRKIIYLLVSISIMFFIAILIGLLMSK